MSVFDAIMSFFGGKGIPQGCKFTLSCAGQNIILPVTPASFKVGRTYNNSTLNINAIGEINMLGKRGLQTLSFEGFFPAQKYEWSETNETNPYNLVRKIDGFAISGKPCKISISNTSISMYCTIESFNHDEHDGTSDVYYEMTLKEYRYIKPTSEIKNDTTGLHSRIAEALEEQTVTSYPKEDFMDTANKAVSKIMPIAEQGEKALNVYKIMIKSGESKAGAALKVSKRALRMSGKEWPL
ncbi:phage baseplate protein [Veillonella montpellierensis]|uniref:phage baseplate protein n=1 Tax=Veillonella montpellierensis TaxID=187328 RepID=UPI0023F9B8D4|nr:hypothetical protein [Veillonella montpellierensis]